MRILKWVIAAAVVLWVISLPLAAYAATAPQTPLTYGFAFAIYGVGSFVCHQRPDRSFHLWMAALPVCARCTGIYFGGACAVIATASRAPVVRRVWLVIVAAALPTVATLAYEWTTGTTPANWIRACAGLPMGLAVGSIVMTTVRSSRHSSAR